MDFTFAEVQGENRAKGEGDLLRGKEKGLINLIIFKGSITAHLSMSE